MAEENATIEWKERLKALLGVVDDEKDIFVEIAIESAEETIKNYCHIEEVPGGLSATVLRMAADIYRNEQPGTDSVPQVVSSVTIGDTSTSFKTSAAEYAQSVMKNYERTLNRYRRVVF